MIYAWPGSLTCGECGYVMLVEKPPTTKDFTAHIACSYHNCKEYKVVYEIKPFVVDAVKVVTKEAA